MNHELKCWPSFFVGLKSGRKLFEVRRDDRGFSEGDTCCIKEFLDGRGYTGDELHFSISSILRDFPGVMDGYCVLGLQRIHVHKQSLDAFEDPTFSF